MKERRDLPTALGMVRPQNAEGPPCLIAQPTPLLQLQDVLERFEREAVQGICATGRYRCSYISWGVGPPLVFMHGLGDLAYSFVPVMSILAKDFRCIAYDQPGKHGDGAHLGRYTHPDLVHDLFALLDHLGVRQSYVYGSSFGSTIALRAMQAEPERIPRAILGGGFARRTLAPAERFLARLGRYLPGSARHLPFRKLIGQSCLGPLALKRLELFEFFLRNTGDPSLRAMAQRAWMIHELDLGALLSKIHQPVLLVCGDCDRVVGRDCEEVLLQGLPQVARVEVPDCGHMPHYTHPETLAELIRRFLTPPSACCDGEKD
ncbi:MAG TPA: alpha/beta hydrolase [Gemmataceae bacterium]|nr:alpha/beta hydrolase [Gemmataceae bacterium]